jgi:hypothetical protein
MIKFDMLCLLKDIQRSRRASMPRFYMQRANNCQRRSKTEQNQMRRMQTRISSQRYRIQIGQVNPKTALFE